MKNFERWSDWALCRKFSNSKLRTSCGGTHFGTGHCQNDLSNFIRFQGRRRQLSIIANKFNRRS
jgi:hypothetical protein